ncbi:hypothetical protein FAZ69_02875 [Trinickia terrae]|uniref:Uncharacterized protein n=1 Tax=Trinickia terrae TaxID=2571161 RepID=A0A4U1IFU1_9BURK|nr:hypothetical protein [Trinickia terrae]TKC92626.1 hypothetical protein FAZ69_02875 [Trinickia terrae]
MGLMLGTRRPAVLAALRARHDDFSTNPDARGYAEIVTRHARLAQDGTIFDAYTAIQSFIGLACSAWDQSKR